MKRLLRLVGGSALLAVLCLVASSGLGLAGVSRLAGNVACGDVITQDTTLTADLYCPGSDGLVIGASYVTLDLAGHTLRGDGNGTGVIKRHLDDFFHDITIENGVVRNFASGISLGGFFDYFIENMKVTNNVEIGIGLSGDSVSVSDSTVAFNGGSGITTVQGILDTPSGIYSNDRVFHNGGDGIYTSESPSYFNGNRVTDNAGDGTFNLDDAWSFAPFYHYKNNTADRNGGVGITLSILEGGTPQSVDDQGGNEAKLNAGGQCAVFGLTCSSIAWR